jgi:hypothetical protein
VKALAVLFAVSVLSPAAHAEVKPVGTLVPVLACYDARNIADAGIQVMVYSRVGYSHHEIDVAEQSIAGPVKLGTVKARQQSITAIGAPIRFVGKNLSLSINFTVSPIHGRFAPGRIDGKVGKEKVANDLKCEAIYTTQTL